MDEPWIEHRTFVGLVKSRMVGYFLVVEDMPCFFCVLWVRLERCGSTAAHSKIDLNPGGAAGSDMALSRAGASPGGFWYGRDLFRFLPPSRIQ